MSTKKPHESPSAIALTRWRDTQVRLDENGVFGNIGPSLFTNETITHPTQARILRALEKDAQLMRKPLRPWDTFSFSPEKIFRGVRTSTGLASRGELFGLLAVDVIHSTAQEISIAHRWCAFAAVISAGENSILRHVPKMLPKQRTDVNISARALDKAVSDAGFQLRKEAMLLLSILMGGGDQVVRKYMSSPQKEKKRRMICDDLLPILTGLQQLQMDPATQNPMWVEKLPGLFDFFFRQEKNPEDLLECSIFSYIDRLADKQVSPHDVDPTSGVKQKTYQQHLMDIHASEMEKQGNYVNAVFDAMRMLDMTLSPQYLKRLDVIFEFLPTFRAYMPSVSAVWAKTRLTSA